MEKNFGIFIRGEYQGRENFFMKKCQELLKRVNSEATIKNIRIENIRRGIGVHFDRDVSESQLFFLTKYLCDDASVTVHSLTTSLVVLEAYPDDEVDFVEDVRKQLLKIWNMKVLDVKKIPLSEQFTHIGTGKYVVDLQVPEVDDLEEFKAMGLPDDMVLELPSYDGKLKVKFYCRRCLEEGHVQSSCSNQLNNHVSTTVLNPSSKRPLQESEVSNPKPKKPRGPEAEEVNIGDRRIYQLDDHVSTTVLNQPSERPLQGDQSEVSNPKPNIERAPEPEADGNRESRKEVSAADVYPDLDNVDFFEGNRSDGRTEPSAPNYKTNQGTPDKFPSRPPNRITKPPSKIIIPNGIRKVICGLPNPVLDVDALQGLFNFTKRRSNVQMTITEIYTPNVEGLRQQLKDTINNYQKQRIIGSLEDDKFVKWIQKFLKRF